MCFFDGELYFAGLKARDHERTGVQSKLRMTKAW